MTNNSSDSRVASHAGGRQWEAADPAQRKEQPECHPQTQHSPGMERAEPGFSEIIQILRTEQKAIWVALISCLLLAFLYLVLTPSQYTASTLILVENRTPFLSSMKGQSLEASADSRSIETLVEILRSDRIARRVIQEQKLLADREIASGHYIDAVKNKDGNQESNEAALFFAVERFRSRFEVGRRPGTNIIEVIFSHSNPIVAARIANATARIFLNDQLAQRDSFIRETSEWMRERSLDLRSKAHQAERELLDLRKGSTQSDSRNASFLRDVEMTAQAYRDFSENYQRMILEVTQNLQFPTTEARIVAEAFPPRRTSHPRILLTLVLATALGVSIGCLVALLRSSTIGSK